VHIWSPLSNEHVLPLLDIHVDGHSPPELKVPYCKEGNILDHNRRCPNANKLLQITQLAAGISYLHKEGVEHGNICPVRSLVQEMPLVCRLTISAGKHFDQGRWRRLHL
jgi:serine/threonine protein kinase